MKSIKSLSPSLLAKYYANQNEVTKNVIGGFISQSLTSVRIKEEISLIAK